MGYGGPPGEPYAGPPVVPPSRLSPLILLIDPVRMLPSLFLPLAGVLFVGGFSPTSFLWALVAVLGSIGYAAVRWATFTYQVSADRLELRRSLISRSTRSIPLDRVRGVDVTTPPLHRLLGLAVVRVDTGAGGGDKQEGEIDGITLAEAGRLRETLLRRSPVARREPGHAGVTGEAAPGRPEGAKEAEAEHEHVYVRVPSRWFLYGPLSGAFLLTPFALVSGAIGLIFQWGREFGINERAAWSAGQWLWQHPLLLVLVAVLLVLAMPVVGTVMYAVLNWNFTLRRRGSSLVAERGLITRRSVALEHARIRGYQIAEGLLERRARVGRLWAIVTGLGDSQTRGQLLPVAPRDFALKTAAEAIGPFEARLRRHPPQARRRRLFRAVAPWLVVALAAFALGWAVAGTVALVAAALGVALGLDRYRSLGHAYDGTRLSVRSGSLPRTQAVVERRALVGWTIRQTWFQRRSRVLTVIAGVGAGSGGYAAIDTGEDQGIAFAAEVTPDWMRPFLTEP
ncbi:PH domain-containing protein [Sphaerisporangium sp. TRM90804]|uniref:PH domain-containing protein n=1 Tax=Sphaerisporangium sp. TRM90804 TaxID=3031113 RepID=UPI002449F382|nr:PH domain-containing protein [Sphaerisporangium sp. TRM90804]MDH2424307.1 PH domain-containing protein [Sphaerisporangium sp. TRM90804]